MQGGECWLELSTNNADEEDQILLDHKCPFNLPEFPQLQLTVKCPDDVEQCTTINFCNTGLCWSCGDSLEYHTITQHHQYHTQDYKVGDEDISTTGRGPTKSCSSPTVSSSFTTTTTILLDSGGNRLDEGN
ncbi:hypothetical protein Pcinc_001762 [Petrolisthes cinctipes]|uniref:Uncharacterized protein n=1 Tax=Petrolisthes cinctipes TaxID=88211 RepID=A0AAE1GJJ2_PETCI|nr:hypothetical protein Pcinc_001762 [Petrolisthes cinctipes]